MNILITGTSGFIGFNLARKLLERGDFVIGIDNENDYYDVSIKHDRRAMLEENQNFKFYNGNLQDMDFMKKVFNENKIDRVCNLAAQAGVRYSLTDPFSYIQSNIVGFHNIIYLAKEYGIKNFVYASSSSVYGTNTKQPFSVEDKTDSQISLYAASKKSNELIAHTYSHLYKLPTTGLRFFTVYGPWGRPDMALFKFTKAMLEGKPIDVYNHGKMERDFTYIDDIVDGVIRCIDNIFDYEVFNIGNDNVVQLEYMIELVEKNLGIKAQKNYMGMQPGDVPSTWADIKHTQEKLNWRPTTNIEEGVAKFIDWYKRYYNV